MVAGRYGSLLTLRRRREFLLVQSRGARSRGQRLVLLVLPNPDGETRLGFTVSKKVGNAVVRNRVRRRLRELFRQKHACLLAGHDTVVIAYPGAASASSAELLADLLDVGRHAAKRHRRSLAKVD